MSLGKGVEGARQKSDTAARHSVGIAADWRLCKSKSTGKPYHFNVVTGESTFIKPACVEYPSPSANHVPEAPSRESGAKAAITSKTFLLKVGYLNKTIVKQVLGDGWREVEVSDKEGKIDALFMDGHHWFDKSLWGVHCALKGRMPVGTICRKPQLHALLRASGSTYIPETFEVQRGAHLMLPSSGGTWVWRPDVREGGGRGLSFVRTQQELNEQIWKLRRQEYNAAKGLLTKFIDNLELFPVTHLTQHKFHLRIYFIAFATQCGRGNRAAVYRHGEIAVAKKPFAEGNYADLDIHDTRLKASGDLRGMIKFPEDYPGGEAASSSVFEQVVASLSEVTRLAVVDSDSGKGLRPYDGAVEGYHVMGCDFMVDKTGKVWLIEINAAPALGASYAGKSKTATPSETTDYITRVVFEGIDEFVLNYEPGVPLKRVVECSKTHLSDDRRSDHHNGDDGSSQQRSRGGSGSSGGGGGGGGGGSSGRTDRRDTRDHGRHDGRLSGGYVRSVRGSEHGQEPSSRGRGRSKSRDRDRDRDRLDCRSRSRSPPTQSAM
jgi:hypothetical protein